MIVESGTAKDAKDTNAYLWPKAFERHVLTERRPWCWKVSRPGTWSYGFYVLVAPGAVVIYGDLGEAVFRMNAGDEQEALDWAVRCSPDQHYALSKLSPRDAYRAWFEGDAVAWLKTLPETDDTRHELLALAEDGLTPGEFYRAVNCSNHRDSPSCEDWSSAALWLSQALALFGRLVKAKRAAEALPEGTLDALG